MDPVGLVCFCLMLSLFFAFVLQEVNLRKTVGRYGRDGGRDWRETQELSRLCGHLYIFVLSPSFGFFWHFVLRSFGEWFWSWECWVCQAEWPLWHDAWSGVTWSNKYQFNLGHMEFIKSLFYCSKGKQSVFGESQFRCGRSIALPGFWVPGCSPAWKASSAPLGSTLLLEWLSFYFLHYIHYFWLICITLIDA